jgi:hypothetical protein
MNVTKVNEVHVVTVGKIMHFITSSPSETLIKHKSITIKRLSFQDANYKASRIVSCPVKNVWLTGFLRFGSTKENHQYTLFFEDTKTKIPVFFDKRPSVELLDGLLLLKDWQLVYDKVMTPAYLEIKAFKWIQRPEDQAIYPIEQLFRQVVLPLYTVYQDAPLYTGFLPWQNALDSLKETKLLPSTVPVQTEEPQVKKQKPNKKRKFHVVYGQISCKSPVSQQKDPEGCHFFVEIQAIMDNSQQESLVQVMFVGQKHLKWYFFLHLGMKILLTDLCKVFSKECNLFLLQSTSMTQVLTKSNGKDADAHQSIGGLFVDVHFLSTSLLINKRPHVVFNYRGFLTKILTKDCWELDDGKVLLLLVHFPLLTPDLFGVRVGHCLQIYNAHVLNDPLGAISYQVGNSITLGLCVRSGLEVIKFCPQEEKEQQEDTESLTLLPAPLKTMEQLFHIDFKCLPLQIAAWLIQAFHTIVIQIHGSLQMSTIQNKNTISTRVEEWRTSIKKRQLVKQIGVLLGIIVLLPSDLKKEQEQHQDKDEEKSTRNSQHWMRTLGYRFLLSHQVDNSFSFFFCTSILSSYSYSSAPHSIVTASCHPQQKCPLPTLMSIQQIQSYCQKELTKSTPSNIKKPWSIVEFKNVHKKSIEFTNLSILIGGFLEGNDENGDLCLVDATGQINLKVVDNTNTIDHLLFMNINSSNVIVYFVLTRFKLIAEMYTTTKLLTQQQQQQQEDPTCVHFTFALLCDAKDLKPIFFPTRSPMNEKFVSQCPSVPPFSTIKDFFLLVTQVDTCKKKASFFHSIQTSSENYRHLHGIAVVSTRIEVGEKKKKTLLQHFDWTKTCQVELLVNLKCPHWFVKSGQWYFIQEAMIDSKATTNGQPPQYGKVDRCQCPCPCSMKNKEFMTWKKTSFPFEILRLEPSSIQKNLLLSVSFELTAPPLRDSSERMVDVCTCWTTSQKDLNGLYDFTTTTTTSSSTNSNSSIGNKKKVQVSSRDLLFLSVLTSQEKQKIHEKIRQVCDLYILPLPMVNSNNNTSLIHSNHYISIMGLIVSIRYIKRPLRLRRRPIPSSKQNKNWFLLCRLRDTQALDYVDIHISIDLFGPRSASLQIGQVVLFRNLIGYISRHKYKVSSLEWSHRTSVHFKDIPTMNEDPPKDEAQVLYDMKTTFLYDMYVQGFKYVDRRLHRWLVRIVHLQYFVLKQKCLHCHQNLKRIVTRKEQEDDEEEEEKEEEDDVDPPHPDGIQKRRRRKIVVTQYRWTHPLWMSTSSCFSSCPFLVNDGHHPIEDYSYVSANLRCVVDDGTGQAELHVEDNVAWDLLGTAIHQRKHLEKVFTENVHLDEWTFFANNVPSSNKNDVHIDGGSTTGTTGMNTIGMNTTGRVVPPVFTSIEYYQNVLDDFILACIKERTSPIVVIGRRFWKKQKQKPPPTKTTNISEQEEEEEDEEEAKRDGDCQVDMSIQDSEHHPTSVLTLGQDVHIITNTLPMLQLEAVRVDSLHARHEVTRLLKKLQRSK